MTSPPSGLPVARSHTQAAVAMAVNATRRASIESSLCREGYTARGTASRSGEGAGELGEDGQVGVVCALGTVAFYVGLDRDD
jgi:hypothetical protein